MEAYNRAPAPISRSESYSRPESRLAYGPDVYNGGGERSFVGGERGYSQPSQTYRAPTQQAYRGYSEAESFGRSDFSSRSSQSFGSQSFKEPKSSGGGFHMFGGGNSFKRPSFKEPKFSAPKFKEPKMSSRSFGGGGHSSGGHSGGGKHHG